MVARSSRAVLKMGQKIHPTAFRLGSRICWDSLWSTTNKDYGTKYIINARRNKLLNDKFGSQGIIINSTNLLNTNKNFHAITKCFKENIFLSNLNKENETNLQTETRTTIKQVSSFSILDQSLTDLKILSITPINKKQISINKQKAIIPIISAQSVSNYISSQIAKSYRQKNKSFKKSLAAGITEVTLSIMKQFQKSKLNLISGFKVECSGRWKQTGTGRTQKFRFIMGNIPNQSINKFISYGFSTTHTKYGSCGFKVWLCYNSLS